MGSVSLDMRQVSQGLESADDEDEVLWI